MFTVENHNGRLIEVRMQSPVTTEEIEHSSSSMAAVLQWITPKKGVVVGDYSHVRVLRPAQANRLIEIFRYFSPRIERSGLLIAPESAVTLLQLQRVIRHANNPARRTFNTVEELKDWLYDVLNPGERARLDDFFGAANI
jgi:hypothetical protein